MPEEISFYFEKKYSDLKEKAKTYGDLEELIRRTVREEKYTDSAWGILLHRQLMDMLHEEWSSLPIIR